MLLQFENFKLFEEDNLPGFALLLPYSEYMDLGTKEEANLFFICNDPLTKCFFQPRYSVLCQVV